eukprot:CAMPEP_0202030346 /NCGR_PEP_ID=MMETSP0905-20130828/64449_1 /ASSEMBLY_ACC=CAM_ASM_000554 /TAXON_ID=420261 /ORGANISM="Thalassiosira antarctica, Strain CCMP982" /LENGTH=593 /DNA_ID=CAMNT_0048594141 /DNA_START=38 /DNA_END=1819 /DNA_ORIENTATION=-
MEIQATTCTDGIIVMLPGNGSKMEPTTATAAAVSPLRKNKAATAKLKSPASPSSSTSSSEYNIPNEIQEALNLSFPRCSCCQTGWYDAIIAGGNDDDDDELDTTTTKPAAGKRKRRDRPRDRPSHYNLFPMPKCGCTTRLALPHNLPSAMISSADEYDDCQKDHPWKVLSQMKTHSFPNLAICKSCLKRRIAASNDVTVHDYRQEHIPNGQRNVKFTVEADCVQCKRKFMGRVLERLLDSEGGPKSNNVSGSSRKKKGKADANWWDAVEATIQFVGWAKRESRRERRRMSRQKRAEKMMNQSREINENQLNERWWENHNGFTRGNGDCSSDECYSLPSDSNDEWQSDNEPRPTKGPHRLQLKSGELMEELLQKDPKFRQEREDEQYVKKVVEEEEETQKAAAEARAREDHEMAMKLEEKQTASAEARAREDHELAMKMQDEFDKNNSKLTPVKKSPIFDAWKKASSASAKKPDGERSPTVEHANQLGATSRSISSSIKLSPGESIALPQSPISTTNSPGKTGPDPRKCNHLEPQSSSHTTTPINDTSIEDAGVDEIVVMGFTEAAARRCLKDANGNVQLAVSMLLSELSDLDR